MVAHAFDSGTHEVEGGESLSSLKPLWSSQQVLEQLELYNKTLSQRKKKSTTTTKTKKRVKMRTSLPYYLKARLQP